MLNIEDKTYFVVSATLEVLLLLLDYVKLVINVEILTTDAMAKTIEYLKVNVVPVCASEGSH